MGHMYVTPVSDSSGTNTPAPIAAGTNLIGDVAQQARTNATGAMSPVKILSIATNNAYAAKASPGRVFGWTLYNSGAAVAYLKLYNKTTTPVVGTDATALVVAIPAGQVVNFNCDIGIAFGIGIGMALVTGAADTDNTAVTANQIVGHFNFA